MASLRVQISSVEEWNTNLRVKALLRAPLRERKPATALTGDNDSRIRRLALADQQGKRKGLVAGRNELPSHRNDLPSHRTDLPLRHKSSLPVPVPHTGREGSEIARNRATTLQILEGTLRPAPDRDYPDEFAVDFWHFAHAEAARVEREAARDHARRVLKQALCEPPTPLCRGWRFIRALILSELDAEQARAFPAYAEAQRAFLLTVEVINGRERVVHFRNLDACPMHQLVGLLKKMEDRGWRDVVWVSSTRESPPRTLSMVDEGVKELQWGMAEGVREIRA